MTTFFHVLACQVPGQGWAQILAYMSLCEVTRGGPGSDIKAGKPGDFGWLPEYYSDTRRNAELANGRLAMMAITGMVFQECSDDKQSWQLSSYLFQVPSVEFSEQLLET